MSNTFLRNASIFRNSDARGLRRKRSYYFQVILLENVVVAKLTTTTQYEAIRKKLFVISRMDVKSAELLKNNKQVTSGALCTEKRVSCMKLRGMRGFGRNEALYIDVASTTNIEIQPFLQNRSKRHIGSKQKNLAYLPF